MPPGACWATAGGESMSDFLNTQHVRPARIWQAMRPWRQLYCVLRMPWMGQPSVMSEHKAPHHVSLRRRYRYCTMHKHAWMDTLPYGNTGS